MSFDLISIHYFQYQELLLVEQPSLPLLELVNVEQFYDKFPQKGGGLKELYENGPQNAFFLVHVCADLNTKLQNDVGAFSGVSSRWVFERHFEDELAF